ncbi:MAG TPA: ribosomal-protein-alanine N-acetyltransferase [Elusimicrobia bacterium]|nr:ribosomal-protein-alanine N-acetyltransferase [Elusimicrobiota bacterium]HBT61000.1 ribosomal-protein-alanine N-acetyltransferase [Elusimicrobiota bacterium]
MSVRPARLADLDSIRAISAACSFSARWSRAQYGQEIGSRNSHFLVWDEGEVRGFILALKVGPEAQVVDLAVRPRDQGRGVGRALIQRLATEAREGGFSRITLEVSAANDPALRLYRRAGFEVVGRRGKFYNDGSDAILMDLILA